MQFQFPCIYIAIFFILYFSSRKRRPSYSQDEVYGEINTDVQMNECNAALVLMSLSCSPHSPKNGKFDTFCWHIDTNLFNLKVIGIHIWDQVPEAVVLHGALVHHHHHLVMMVNQNNVIAQHLYQLLMKELLWITVKKCQEKRR